MGKLILWTDSVRTREIYGLTFAPGEAHQVDDELKALDILTQPGEPFVEIPETEVKALGEIVTPKRLRALADLRIYTPAGLAKTNETALALALGVPPEQARQFIERAGQAASGKKVAASQPAAVSQPAPQG